MFFNLSFCCSHAVICLWFLVVSFCFLFFSFAMLLSVWLCVCFTTGMRSAACIWLKEGRSQSKIGDPSTCFSGQETAGSELDNVVLNLVDSYTTGNGSPWVLDFPSGQAEKGWLSHGQRNPVWFQVSTKSIGGAEREGLLQEMKASPAQWSLMKESVLSCPNCFIYDSSEWVHLT